MYIVLLDGADVRFLGGSAAARNARVARRVGVPLRSLHDLATTADETAVLVPSGVALMVSFFREPAFLAAATSGSAAWLEAAPGAAVVVGPAQVLAAANDVMRSRLPRQPVGAHTLFALTSRAARRQATRGVLRATQKPTDGWVSRTLNRPLSRSCSRLALAAGLSANMASLLTLLVGLGCAWIAAQPGYVPLALTGVLFQLASVLDGVDGEIARATLTESERGSQVDTIVDQVTYVACFAGATIGWVRQGSGAAAFGTTLAIGLALVLTLLRGGRFVARHAEDASFVFIDRAVRRAARDTRRLPLRVAAGAFTLLRRDVFAVIFLVVCLTGVRALIPLLILAGIVIANLTFSVYGPELATAARAERGMPQGAVAQA